MDIFKIAIIGIAGTLLAGILKEQKKEYALYVGLATVIVIFSMIIKQLSAIFDFFRIWQQDMSYGEFYVPVILKILGVAYIADFTSQICKDAGENAIGGKVDMAGKVMVFYLAIPVMTSIMELINTLLPG
ncbi:MAG: stage III sporulation protein AD [Firmicutes bacterium]|nr:stage III sporulation protein AD [Bacillota bacterium]